MKDKKKNEWSTDIKSTHVLMDDDDEIGALKPCKHCGSFPKFYMVGDNKQYFIMKCPKCNYTPIPTSNARFTKLEAMKEWNKWI